MIVDAVASSDNADDFLVFPGGATAPGAGGVYRTTDGGATFKQATGVPAGFASGDEFYWNVSLERDATDLSVRFLFLRNRGFYKSTDRGASWTKSPAQPRNSFAIMHVDPISGRIWTGTGFFDDGSTVGFDYSDDRGASWHALKGVDSVTEFDVRDGRLVLLGRLAGETTDQIHFSANNGTSWREITRTGFRFANAQAVAIDPWRPGTVWISTTGRSISRFTPDP